MACSRLSEVDAKATNCLVTGCDLPLRHKDPWGEYGNGNILSDNHTGFTSQKQALLQHV